MTSTETASRRYATIEDWSSTEIVEGIVEGQFSAIAAVQSARAAIAEVIDRAAQRLEAGGRLIYLGAGTSGRIATQDASELPPTFSWPYERAVSLMAGGDSAFTQAAEGAEDSEQQAVDALERLGVNDLDVVLGIAASGRTPFAIAGLVHAREKGALTVGIYNNPEGRIGAVCELPILLDTGPEFLAGSTRMKAGTAQKAALNCISTGVMMKLGFVYRGLMVEMRATNAKLRERAVRMVAQIAQTDADAARATLETADGSIKLASLMLARSLDRNAAQARLDAAKGNLRRAMEG
ncbi:N-acetylmuramic acid 6-phosphate etherase [Pelagibacterium xiamenense]|uniref:N-acetylmuramic acid 6-phosphate etherase n=1 Tax=Pelagibacterium xiamenense TaxID=2901140 RepID=UPI001E2D4924|nr:N-acetylmuramic acid 6-phosphate etherase [Pelagibacterium xiamenense]MCD7061374.1 N-acetylmuramic acid 6-phosphate etherase [Pelagibacterium xiamenense]